VERAAAKLRTMAASKENGEFLGSEDDLIEILGVSRPTLRQASAQVIQENLITVRRGVSGGFFARLPESGTVSRVAAIFLQSRKTRLPEVLQAIKPLRIELAMLAARNRRDEDLATLREFIDAENEIGFDLEKQTFRSFLRSERAFGRIVSELSRNDVLALFLNILYDLIPMLRRDEDILIDHPERVALYRRHRITILQAILDGDEEMAQLSSRRCSDLIVDWMVLDRSTNESVNSTASSFDLGLPE
jgi:DNA-binding FadR family transcriptional regulator